MTPSVDVERWALERREELAEIYRKRGAIPRGAMVLVTRDPKTLTELPAPETLEQSSTDYDNYSDFVQALRNHCLRCAGLGAVVFGEAMIYPDADPRASREELSLRRRAGEGYPVVAVSFACRGRVQAKLWTARVVRAGKKVELEAFEESHVPQGAGDLIFPMVN